MKINSISSINFNGLYKLDRDYVGENTESFMLGNVDVVYSSHRLTDDIFVLTPDEKDAEFEECVKKDNSKYWKSKSLSDLIGYPKLLDEIFKFNFISNNYKENWTDYSNNHS